VPAGAFRGYGLPQTLLAVEAAIDELAKGLGINPFEFRRRNIVKPGDPMLSPPGSGHTDVVYGSYGSINASTWSSARWRPRDRKSNSPPIG